MNPEQLERWDKKYIWHPFTQHTEWEKQEPLIVRSGRGMYLQDVQGKRYLDGVSSLWVNVHGHRVPALDAAVRRQLRRVAHSTFLGLTHEPAIRLAKRLVEIAPPGLTRVFYSDNGSTAVEVALKMAYQFQQLRGRPGTQRVRFLSLKGAYHGDTVGSVSVGGIEIFHARFRHLLFKGFKVAPGNLGEAERLLRRHHRRIAAAIIEPLIQGAAGMKVMPKGYTRQLWRLCKRYGVLFIADEVATGFGRTGTMFAVEQEKAQPDFLCVAKSITGGYLPLAATLTTEPIYRAFLGRFDEFKTFFHGHTYTANPLACAVALANLDLYRRNGVLQNVRARAKDLAAFLHSLEAHPHVRDVRQVGLMAGIELVQDKARGLPYPPGWRVGYHVCLAARARGVFLRPLGDVIVLMPPLAISQRDLEILCRAVHGAMEEVTVTRR